MTIKITKTALGTFAFVASVATANAQSYSFDATGVLGSPYTTDRDFKQVANPTSSIKEGDTFRVHFDLTPAGAIPTGLYDADPSVNIYYHYVTNFSFTAGKYTTNPIGNEKTFATVQLWNNYGSGQTDYFGISMLRNLPGGTSPVDLGSGNINGQFHYDAFDSTGTARSSDSISELPPLSRYGSTSAFIGFLNGDSYLGTNFQVRLSSATLIATAVPEPATWAMMILGMGAVGFAMRRRNKNVTTTVAYAA